MKENAGQHYNVCYVVYINTVIAVIVVIMQETGPIKVTNLQPQCSALPSVPSSQASWEIVEVEGQTDDTPQHKITRRHSQSRVTTVMIRLNNGPEFPREHE